MSVASVVSSRLAPRFARRFGDALVIPFGSLMFAVSMGFFVLWHDALWCAFVTTAIAGAALGFTFAAMPGLIIRAVPPGDTGSAISVNQLTRSIGFSVGSALSAVVLAANTPSRAAYPSWSGYRAGLLLGVLLWLATAVISFVVPALTHPGDTDGGGSSAAEPADELLMEESGELGGGGVPFRP